MTMIICPTRNVGTHAENMRWLASVTKIRVNADGSFKVISVGDIGHIPPNLRTGASGDPDRSLVIPALP